MNTSEKSAMFIFIKMGCDQVGVYTNLCRNLISIKYINTSLSVYGMTETLTK